jgi:putative SbcD/Mre11-related phosphoesterase
MDARCHRYFTVGPWQLAPEGAAIHPGERLAVVADVHLGYEWARGAAGDSIPAHSLDETQRRLSGLLARAAIERLVVAGDLVESSRPCRQTDADVASLASWLAARNVTLICLAGNHDPRRSPPLQESLAVAGWTIAHGHLPIAAGRRIVGHGHPVLRAGGVNTPCFLVSARKIVLPAFTTNAAGCNVAGSLQALPDGWRDRTLHCVVPSDPEWLDFGRVVELRRRLGWGNHTAGA